MESSRLLRNYRAVGRGTRHCTRFSAFRSSRPTRLRSARLWRRSMHGPRRARRAILLLGPAPSDHTIWGPLLCEAERADAGSTNAGAYLICGYPARAGVDRFCGG